METDRLLAVGGERLVEAAKDVQTRQELRAVCNYLRHAELSGLSSGVRTASQILAEVRRIGRFRAGMSYIKFLRICRVVKVIKHAGPSLVVANAAMIIRDYLSRWIDAVARAGVVPEIIDLCECAIEELQRYCDRTRRTNRRT